MKKLLLLLVLVACGTSNDDWDSGAQKQQADLHERRQEQIENTNMQDTIPGRGAAGQTEPF
jgi:hypothetical protein